MTAAPTVSKRVRMDFGKSASDYKTHRAGFPTSFFERVPLRGRVLDVGAGTGTISRGYTEQGCACVALDRSAEMLAAADGPFEKVVGTAEALPFPDGTFDAVVAGQCWHWFDGITAAREAHRVLKPGGTLIIAHFDYLAADGNAAHTTEELILQLNPSWKMAGSTGIYDRWRPHLEGASLNGITSFWYDETVQYSHEAWRGRIRACNGVLAIPDRDAREQLDRNLAQTLAATFADPLDIPHRVFVLRASR